MTKLIATLVGMVVAGLMVPSVVHAQNVIAVHAIQGTIQAADCQAKTLTLKAVDGSARVVSTVSSTAVFVNSAAADLCMLPQYVGSGATVWFTDNGDQLLAGRVDVSVAAAPDVPEAAPYYGPDYGPYYPPYGPYYRPYFYGPIVIGPGFHDRRFHHDRDFHHDRYFHGGDRGGPHGVPSGVPHGGGMNGGSHGGGHGGGRR